MAKREADVFNAQTGMSVFPSLSRRIVDTCALPGVDRAAGPSNAHKARWLALSAMAIQDAEVNDVSGRNGNS